jgi:hypothetical protein
MEIHGSWLGERPAAAYCFRDETIPLDEDGGGVGVLKRCSGDRDGGAGASIFRHGRARREGDLPRDV